MNSHGLCAIVFGEDRTVLFEMLSRAFPGKTMIAASPAFADFISGVVSGLINRPAAPISIPLCIHDGDFGHIVRAALSMTKPGTTITPEEVVKLVRASPGAEANVRKHAANDILAIAVPFHRLQEEDGTSPAYRWGEKRRRALLAREIQSGT